MKKKKIKIKKKNFTIFIIIISLISFILFELTLVTIKIITTPREKPIEKKEEKKKKDNKKKEEKKTDPKLDELENIKEKISYFKEDNIERYLNYRNNNPDLEIIQVIKNVNMNLDKKQYEDATEIENKNNQLVLVNKYNYLGDKFIPENLENINTQYALSNMKLVDYAKEAFEKMSKDARKENLKIIAMSTYRSYSYQVDLYNRYKKKDGQEAADKYSGRPGFSEHQSGLAVDVYNGKEDYTNFESTKEFTWMKDHAHEYGFIIRFPKGKENETGYQYESWHYRYVGIDVATYIKNNNISLEEYIATK